PERARQRPHRVQHPLIGLRPEPREPDERPKRRAHHELHHPPAHPGSSMDSSPDCSPRLRRPPRSAPGLARLELSVVAEGQLHAVHLRAGPSAPAQAAAQNSSRSPRPTLPFGSGATNLHAPTSSPNSPRPSESDSRTFSSQPLLTPSLVAKAPSARS